MRTQIYYDCANNDVLPPYLNGDSSRYPNLVVKLKRKYYAWCDQYSDAIVFDAFITRLSVLNGATRHANWKGQH